METKTYPKTKMQVKAAVILMRQGQLPYALCKETNFTEHQLEQLKKADVNKTASFDYLTALANEQWNLSNMNTKKVQAIKPTTAMGDVLKKALTDKEIAEEV